jgi:DinB superfamily
MTKTAIMTASEAIFKKVADSCSGMEEAVFFEPRQGKWSAAENLQHLIISTNLTTIAYSLPHFIVRWYAGTPNRASRTYDEVKTKYYQKLSEGGRAPARFVPRSVDKKYSKQKLLDKWNRATEKYLRALDKRRTEEDLDNYLAKHPLLGRITLRELCYFTVFHTEHHLQTILKPAANP